MTTNGLAPAALAADLRERFDFAQWRRLTELALAHAEQGLVQARDAITAAQGAVMVRQREIEVLRRALALEPVQAQLVPVLEASALPPPPEPPAHGTHPGLGVGGRAAAYLLEVARYTEDGILTWRRAQLACKSWASSTVADGLRRLVADGLLEKTGRGEYCLTEAGRAAGSAGPGMLPLKEPVADDVAPQ